MTQKAINFMNIAKGGNPSTIEQLLRMQNPAIVDEYKEHFGTNDLTELAVRLSFR